MTQYNYNCCSANQFNLIALINSSVLVYCIVYVYVTILSTELCTCAVLYSCIILYTVYRTMYSYSSTALYYVQNCIHELICNTILYTELYTRVLVYSTILCTQLYTRIQSLLYSCKELYFVLNSISMYSTYCIRTYIVFVTQAYRHTIYFLFPFLKPS